MNKRAKRRLRGKTREQNSGKYFVEFGGKKYQVSATLLVTDQQYFELTFQQVKVGYKKELNHKDRQHWLKNRTYSATKPTAV